MLEKNMENGEREINSAKNERLSMANRNQRCHQTLIGTRQKSIHEPG